MFAQVADQVLFAPELILELISCNVYEAALLTLSRWVGFHDEFVV